MTQPVASHAGEQKKQGDEKREQPKWYARPPHSTAVGGDPAEPGRVATDEEPGASCSGEPESGNPPTTHRRALPMPSNHAALYADTDATPERPPARWWS
jgi:hypothetical protein